MSKELDATSSLESLFGARVRKLRTKAGWSQRQLGEKVFVSHSRIAQLELASDLPPRHLCEALDAVLGADTLLTELWEVIRKNRSIWPDHFKQYAELEAVATQIDKFASQLVPGLIQTTDYARAIFRAARPYADDEEIDALVDARLSRGAILEGPSRPGMWLIMDESVIRRPVGGPTAMKEQLAHIAALVRSRQVVVQLIPFALGAHAALEGPLTLLEFKNRGPIAYTETQGTSRLMEAPEDVAKRRVAYDLVKAAALPPDASLEFLEDAMKDYEV